MFIKYKKISRSLKSTPKVGLEKSRKTKGYFLFIIRLKYEDLKEIARLAEVIVCNITEGPNEI